MFDWVLLGAWLSTAWLLVELCVLVLDSLLGLSCSYAQFPQSVPLFCWIIHWDFVFGLMKTQRSTNINTRQVSICDTAEMLEWRKSRAMHSILFSKSCWVFLDIVDIDSGNEDDYFLWREFMSVALCIRVRISWAVKAIHVAQVGFWRMLRVGLRTMLA